MLRQQLDTQKHTHETNVAELERENERLLTLNKILETEKKLQSVELSSTNQELTRVQQELAHAQTELRELRVLGEGNDHTTAGDGVLISAYGKKDHRPYMKWTGNSIVYERISCPRCHVITRYP